jgi:Kef-type K+ transport system membrane component KefB
MPYATAPVPPLPANQLLTFLLQVGVLLLLALALGRLANRLGMPTVVGELTAGVLLGPSLLDHIAPGFSGWLLPKDPVQFHLLDAFGQVGVILLVGLTGIQMDLGLVRRRWDSAAGISMGGLFLPFGLGVGAGYVFSGALKSPTTDRTVFALMLGVVMCVSALPVISKTLSDMNLLHRNVGQLTMTAGTIDDAVGWIMLSVVSAMATTGLRADNVVRSVLLLCAIVAGVALVGRPIILLVLRSVGGRRDVGPAVAAVAVMILLGGALTQAAKLEAVFGAFVVGIAIGSCRKAGAAWIVPLRTTVFAVFAPVFFATAGLRMDLTELRRPTVLGTALCILALAVFGKFVGAYFGARLARLNRWEALAIGAGMNARGVIEVIVALVGLQLGVLTTATYTVVVLVAIVTSLMAPPILKFAMARVEDTAEERLRMDTQRAAESLPGDPRELTR